MADESKVDPALDNLRGLLITLKVHARTACELVDEAAGNGASGIASVLAYLEANPADLSGAAATKHALLQSNPRDGLEAARTVAELLGISGS